MLHDLQQYTFMLDAGDVYTQLCVCVCVREKSQRVLCPEFCALTKKKKKKTGNRKRAAASERKNLFRDFFLAI